jgi:beta-D-xylosidase 4
MWRALLALSALSALAGAQQPLTSNCSQAPFSAYLYCDADAPLAARIEDLVARLSPADLQGLLSNGNAGLPAFGVPRLGFGEALHGALTQCGEPFSNATANYTSTGCATSFPTPLALARSLNRTLWRLVGAAIGTESRALHNAGLQGGVVWAPVVNCFRDPRWGRGLETAGEDPLVASEYAAAYIAALQQGDAPEAPYLLVPAQAKHALAYDCEACDGIGRNSFDALVSDHDLVEYFFPPFYSAVTRGRVSGLMCAYNALNGVPSCANGAFLNGVVRGAWGAGGDALAVVSDCGAIREIWKDYFYTADNESAVAAALHGGVDCECPSARTYARMHARTQPRSLAHTPALARRRPNRIFTAHALLPAQSSAGARLATMSSSRLSVATLSSLTCSRRRAACLRRGSAWAS